MRYSASSAGSAVFLSLFILAAHANHQTSLWIPGTDQQPLSAGILGVGEDGRTTWEIQQGIPTGTFTKSGGPAPGFSVTATLVQGPSDAVLSAALTPDLPIAVVMSCTINASGVAVCANTLSQGSSISVGTQTETVSPILVQGGGTVAPTSAVQGSPTTSQASAGLSPTSAGANPTGNAGGTNEARRHQIPGGILALGIVGSVIGYII